jgi:hypothetical protein
VRKIISTTSVVTALVIAATLAPGTVDAGCPGSQFIDATYSYLVSNPNWGGSAGGTGTCGGGLGCYDSVSGPPVSSTMRGVFWALGTGNPVAGVGNDSGTFTGGFLPTDFWIKQVSATFANGLYHYPAWISLKLNAPSGVGPPVTWSAPDVDGCGPLDLSTPVCTCMMLSDEFNGAGYFVTLSAQDDDLGNTFLDPHETIRLAEIPKAVITASSRNTTSGDVTLTISHNPIVGGTFPQAPCPDCLAGFRIYGQIVPRNAPAPTARSSGWLPLTDGSGNAQGTTAFGGSATVRADCDPAVAQDLYLALAIVGEGATPFITSHVSRNSTLIRCGANMAEPGGNRPSDPRPDRGRDGSRSR